MSQEPGTKVKIVAAILAAIAVVIAALIGLYGVIIQTERPIQATQTAEARLAIVPISLPAGNTDVETRKTTINYSPDDLSALTEEEFKRFLTSRYSIVAGKNVEISQVFFNEDPKVGKMWGIIIADNSTLVLESLTEAELVNFGARFLRETKSYLGQPERCVSVVTSVFYTDNIRDEYYDDEDYHITMEWDDSHSGYLITRFYIMAQSVNATDYIKTHFSDEWIVVEN